MYDYRDAKFIPFFLSLYMGKKIVCVLPHSETHHCFFYIFFIYFHQHSKFWHYCGLHIIYFLQQEWE